jgi:hypothetical protein
MHINIIAAQNSQRPSAPFRDSVIIPLAPIAYANLHNIYLFAWNVYKQYDESSKSRQ